MNNNSISQANTVVKAAAVQISPVLHSRDGTIEKVEYEYVQNNVISFIRYENDFGTFEEISHGNYYLNNEYEVKKIHSSY